MPDLIRARWPLAPTVLAVLALLGAPARAQDAADLDAPISLRRTPQLIEVIPPTQRRELPSFVEGDRISGRPDLETTVEGNAVLRRGDTVIRADRLEYDQPTDTATASGNVRVNQAGNEYEGPTLQLKLESFEGFFDSVRYRLLVNGAEGDAQRVDFLDQYRSVAHRATYTTCRREDFPDWMPAWILKAAQIRTNTEENVGEAQDAQLSFFGLTTPPLPSVSFPLTSDRKTGLLPPTIGLDNVNGLEIVQPWYWNIAPNRDATITPTIMTKRGVNLSNEFRYLEETYKGTTRLDYMPTDSLRSRSRWGIWATHNQSFDAKNWGLDSLGLDLNVNRVSDDNYWRDFTRTPSLTSRLLINDASLNWSSGDWSGKVRALKYQTLQYDLATIVPPYDRLPQITADYTKYDWHGFDVALNTDFTRFRGDRALTAQPDAERVYARAEISRPFATPGAYITPKLQLHGTAYQFDAPLANGDNSATRAVPTFSLDSGLVFERDTSILGRAFRQTLEPRAYYVYTPYRNQSNLPVYDTAANDFNFATVFTENEYSGQDRISATNALTLGVTSRLLDPETGAEAVRLGLAQRYRFSDQEVMLPGVTAPAARKGTSDVLLGAQLNWSPKWSLDTTVQYNPETQRSERSAITARYSPGPYRTLSAAFRYQADTATVTGSKSIDLSWQWPLNDLWGDAGRNLGPGRGEGGGRWYAVGRVNYSLRESKLTDGVIGIEYDGCCWIGRVVLERLTTGQATANKRIMFQIEFVGFSSIGASPMRTLQQNIQRYQPLRTRTEAPSRFTNYE